jgi:hypothetical protein
MVAVIIPTNRNLPMKLKSRQSLNSGTVERQFGRSVTHGFLMALQAARQQSCGA